MWKEYIDIIPLGKGMKIPRVWASKTGEEEEKKKKKDRRRLGSPEAKFGRKVVRRYRRKTNPGRW